MTQILGMGKDDIVWYTELDKNLQPVREHRVLIEVIEGRNIYIRFADNSGIWVLRHALTWQPSTDAPR